NLSGEVIGITTAIVPFAQGVGFAVPSHTARAVVEQLRTRGRVVRPWLGISVASMTPSIRRRIDSTRNNGLAVASVVPSSPAEVAGLRPGDVLFRVGSTGIRTMRDLVEALASSPIGGTVDVAFARGSGEHRTMIRLAEAPSARS
ncbi:MAG: S1C family serine protease, partial [Thermoplasmata archaeon]|nr:S1C family serine protease [Thermoplasmata archaeon]